MPIVVGAMCEVRAAFSMDSGTYDLDDEFTGCEALVLRRDRDDALVDIRGIGGVWLTSERLRRVR